MQIGKPQAGKRVGFSPLTRLKRAFQGLRLSKSAPLLPILERTASPRLPAATAHSLPPPTLQGATTATPRPRARFDQHFKRAFLNFSPRQAYRLFIDYADRAKGPHAYEAQEPGYHDAMVHALNAMSATVQAPLDADALLHMHALCCRGVSKQAARSGFSEGSYKLILADLNPAAVNEMDHTGVLASNLLEANKHRSYLLNDSAETTRVCSNWQEIEGQPFANFEAFAHDAVNSIFATYRRDIAAAITPDARLRAMGVACRSLMVGHFFADANLRTVCCCVLNKMLLSHGMSPVVLRNPFALSGYQTADAMVQTLREGQKIYRSLCRP